ncbi:unnamed protein product [Orchesella dallaii]|uniref:Uncharacterized protein n=1 Tax=Orchesella dallaii TaxID=48710 RepID=A0ABP1RPA0_9HEXA
MRVVIIILFVFKSILISGYEQPSQNNHANQIPASESFFRNFHHCLFQLGNSWWEVADNWRAYTWVFNFYAGISSFVLLGQKPEITDSYRKFSNCSVQLHLCDQLKDTNPEPKGWRRDFVWFIALNMDTDCYYDEQLVTSILPRFGYPAIFFVIFQYTDVVMLCLLCNDKKIKINYTHTLTHYENLWKELHSNLNKIQINCNPHNVNWTHVEKYNCNVHKSYSFRVDACAFYVMMKTLNFTGISENSQMKGVPLVHGAVYARQLVSEFTRRWVVAGKYETLTHAMNFKRLTVRVTPRRSDATRKWRQICIQK